MPPLSSIIRALLVAVLIVAVTLFAAGPLDAHGLLVAAELFGVIIGGTVVLTVLVALLSSRLAGWRGSEEEFEALVTRAERLSLGSELDGIAALGAEGLDPLEDDDFEELVRDALDELPDLLRNALRHVAVVISDGGRRAGAYGLYYGRTATRGGIGDRIVVFRDTLRRDFGADPLALRDQVVRTVRHELAHHVGFDEMGVRGLGL